ncbi:TonB-dependent receptor [Aureisphaera galaxeae]|nr:TonB-dependent receptor [Aureisphaera galaxeae]MDC8005378.1 TonB-dependent receptor [Aureisphaera galaxeae]
MRVVLFILCFIGFSISICAQNIRVVDEDNGDPLPSVAIYNEDKSKNALTDFDGMANISGFSDSEAIFFQYQGYSSLSLTKNEIIAAGNRVRLSAETNQLDEVVLSISKFGQNKRDIPQQITAVNSEDVIFRNPQTAADLLEGTGQVYVQKSQLGGGSPLIRGFSTNRLLITVDGVRFNNAIFRGGNVQNVISIDPLSVDRTEVILGPGSVVYGSDAVGGVMNFYTKKPSFSFQEGFDLSGSVLARHATANKEKTVHADINIGGKEWAFLTSVSYSDFQDLKMGSNGPDDYLRNEFVETINGVDTVLTNSDPKVQKFTGYEQINMMQKVRYMPSEQWDLNLGLFYTTTSDYDRYDRLIRKRDGHLRSAEWYYGPQEWISGNIQVSHQQDGVALFDDSKLTLSYQRFKESRNDRDFGGTVLFESDEKVSAYTGGLDFTKKVAPKSTIFYGVEYVYNKVNSEGTQTDITTLVSSKDASRYPDGSTWQSMAAYASLQAKLSSTVSFQGGLRYNHILIDADFTENNQFFQLPFNDAEVNTGALTGSAGLTWQASKLLGWRFNFGTAFRAPNVDDIGKIFDSEPGSVVVPNPDVEAEYSYNFEVGANLNFEDVVKFDLATYYTILKDALVRRDFSLNGQTQIEYQGELSNVQAIQNAGRSRVYGFEAGMEVNFSEDVQLTSQINVTDGYTEEEDGSRVAVRHVAPMFGNSHLLFKKKKWKLDGFVEYNGQFDFEDLAPSQQNNAFLYALDDNGNPFSPSWYTVNFAGQYQVTDALQLTATLENITDQRYRPYSSGIAAPGRNLIVAASYSF